MHLRTGTIHLVEEERREILSVLQERSFVDPDLTVLGDVMVVEKIARLQVDAALDAAVAASQGARDRFEHGRLADADAALEKGMPSREHGDREKPNRTFLFHEHPSELTLEFEGPRSPVRKHIVVTHIVLLF